MTVWIYVDTSKEVGDKHHLKVFANEDAAEISFKENDPEDVASRIGRQGPQPFSRRLLMLSEPEPLWRRPEVRRHQIYAKRLRSFLAPLLTMRSREGPSRTLLPRSRTVPDRGNPALRQERPVVADVVNRRI